MDLASTSVHDTREAILQSSLESFSRKGYVGATISAIAKQAGVNNLTVFRHFQNKENLFRETLNRYADIPLDADGLNRRIDGKSASESLAVISGAFFELMFKNIHIFRVYIIEARHFDFVKQASWRMPPQLLAYLAGYLRGLLPDTGESRMRLPLLTDMFLAHITRLTLQFNKHDSIWEYSPELASAFLLKMKPQIEFFATVALGGIAGRKEGAP